MFKSLAFAGLLLALLLDQAAAQQPTEAQRDAIRAACRSDFIANCSGVQPGGKDAFECLLRNDAKLSPSCRTAVNAAAPKPAEPAAAPPAAAAPEAAPPASKVERAPPGIQVVPTEAQNDQLKSVQQACTLNDFVAHCSWIAPNNPEILQCLKGNAADLSPNCQAAMQALPAAPPPAAAAPAEPPRQAAPAKKPAEPKPAEPAHASAPPPSAAPAAAPTERQKAAVRASCRSDFMSHCSGVQPGGAEALQCLKRNEAQLSAACRSAVAAISGGAPAAAPSGGAPAATAAPAVAPIGPMPMLRPREALAIVQICGVEVRSLCAGVPFGGGRVISCLAANASSLSPNCYGALSAAAGR
jgi:hypothetical protein